jgi:hypothetical protein
MKVILYEVTVVPWPNRDPATIPDSESRSGQVRPPVTSPGPDKRLQFSIGNPTRCHIGCRRD